MAKNSKTETAVQMIATTDVGAMPAAVLPGNAPLTEAVVAQVAAEHGMTVAEMLTKVAENAPPVESSMAEQVSGKLPRSVTLEFAYRAQSPAFIEIMKADGMIGWLRKSAMKSIEVNEGEGKVVVSMDRRLASKRGFLKQAA